MLTFTVCSIIPKKTGKASLKLHLTYLINPLFSDRGAWLILKRSSTTDNQQSSYSYFALIEFYRTAIIDNNGIERSIRPWAIGRKNYLFSGNNKSAEDHCVFYSLLGSCKEAGIDPQEWLNQTLTQLRPEMKAEELMALLPANFTKE